jgi:hypothetical protein
LIVALAVVTTTPVDHAASLAQDVAVATDARQPPMWNLTPPSMIAADDAYPMYLQIQPVMAAFFFRHVLEGARRRLVEPQCGDVLKDFRDENGELLVDRLHDLNETPVQHLSQIRWIDASDADACRNDGRLAAFTSPGRRVVFVCSTRFVDTSYPLRGLAGELVVLHEFLHTLGLGENPPTSSEITEHVRRRCDDSCLTHAD